MTLRPFVIRPCIAIFLPDIKANCGKFTWDLAALPKEKLFFLDGHFDPDVVVTGDFDLSAEIHLMSSHCKS